MAIHCFLLSVLLLNGDLASLLKSQNAHNVIYLLGIMENLNHGSSCAVMVIGKAESFQQ